VFFLKFALSIPFATFFLYYFDVFFFLCHMPNYVKHGKGCLCLVFLAFLECGKVVGARKRGIFPWCLARKFGLQLENEPSCH
jgi:hypothetical protein